MTAKTTAASRPLGVRLLGAFGWLMLACGVAVLLYLAYALLFTNVEAGQAQRDLREQWVAERPVAAVASEAETPAPGASEPVDGPEGGGDGPVVPAGAGVAMIEFDRPGSATTPVHDGPLIVLGGVGTADLERGPGHYPDTALPGRPGNFAVAGHRTTYGAPFFHLDALRQGDLVHVTDRRGRRFTYAVAQQRVVSPADTSVIGPDPLGSGRPTLTFTTCEPRFSAAERLIVHAELVS